MTVTTRARAREEEGIIGGEPLKQPRLDKDDDDVHVETNYHINDITQEELELLNNINYTRPNWLRFAIVGKKGRDEQIKVTTDAYLSIRRKTPPSNAGPLIEILKHDVSMLVLQRCAFCFNRLKDFSSSCREITAQLKTMNGNTNSDAAAAAADVAVALEEDYANARLVSLADTSEPPKCLLCTLEEPRDVSKQFYVKFYNILLILKEILTQMGVQSEFPERENEMEETNVRLCIECGNVVNSFLIAEILKALPEGCGEVYRQVRAGWLQLRRETFIEEALLFEQLSYLSGSNKLAFDIVIDELNTNLRRHLNCAARCLSSRPKEPITRICQNLTGLLWYNIYYKDKDGK